MVHLLRFLKIAGLLCLLGLIVLFLQFNMFALQFVESWQPGTGWIAFLVLTGIEVLGFVLLGLAWMPGRSRLVLKNNPTDEERAAFHAELERRLRSNSLVQEKGLAADDPEYVTKAMAILDARADEIIRQDARKIFLGTALAQNGRLDALIVFVALARMVWRISTTYNQRPTPAEILSVYSAVSSSAFVAFTIDALDIPRTVTEALGSLVPAVAPSMAGTTIPFLGTTMHLFTAAMLDGAANGLLAIRAGILTKNAFCYSTLEKEQVKSRTSKEIRSTMLAISKECITDITTGLKDQVKDMAGSVADNCVEKTVSAARTVASTVSGVASTVTDAASSAGNLVKRGGEAVAEAASSAVGSTVGAVASTATAAASTVGHTTSVVTGTVGDAVSGAVTGTVDFAGKIVSQGSATVVNKVQQGTDTAKKLVRGAGSLLGSVLPGRKSYDPSAEVALDLAFCWSNGPLESEMQEDLRQKIHRARADTSLIALLGQQPDMDALANHLTAFRGQKKDVLKRMDARLGKRAKNSQLPWPTVQALTWLGELGALLGLGTVLADHLSSSR